MAANSLCYFFKLRFSFRWQSLPAVVLGVIFFSFPCAKADPIAQHTRYFTEQNGGARHKVVWFLSPQTEGYQLLYLKETQVNTTLVDQNMRTLLWTMDDAQTASDLRAERKNNLITIQGNLNGRPIHKDIKIDNAPWFQATTLSLKTLVTSEQNEIEFWTLRPGTLKAYKLKATKVGCEQLNIAGQTIQAVKVQLQLSGWLAPFWKSYYWFDAENGLFVRFNGQTDSGAEAFYSIDYSGPASPTCPELKRYANISHGANPTTLRHQPNG